MRYRLVIFDWDGTLMDSVARIVAAMQRAGRELGMGEFAPQQVRDIVGLGLPEAIATLAPGLGPERAEALRQRYVEHFVAAETQAPDTRFFPGVEKGLGALHRQGMRLAVATGKSRRGLDRALGKAAGVAGFFEASRTADLTRSKPDPLMLVELLEETSVDVGQALMVGDSEYDLAMARALGMDAVGVAWGVHAPQRLMRQAPLWVCEDFAALVDWLGGGSMSPRIPGAVAM
ncbi:HAD family hydrolase [Halotalea alkalilenta]|uniref:HAD family hydrolase n=1 Tax=Halotalea alkalilenta TaxID=376489 RepID=UPI0006942452|nr:HAD-IA family hydrolase [Halotalea alkalilenta]